MNRYCIILGFTALALAIAGCSSTSPSAEQAQSRDKALSDPMNYNPAGDRQTVSGGGFLDFDNKAFGKDVNSVLSP